ncbi:PreQ0 pathway QueD-like protein [Mycobacterium phage Funsized]|nr:PreQ0 pathway QueD-like protein [Mycobacterium phage Funsized]
MSVTVTLTFRWAMGHRILGMAGAEKCANIHGHNWVAEVELPNDDGTLEFGAVKDAIGGWIDDTWDHGMLVEWSDPLRTWMANNDSKFDYLPVPPTTEAIAAEIGRKAHDLLDVRPVSVKVTEGYRNAATWRP